MLNAAVWLGATVFCSTGLLAAMNSREAAALIGSQYFAQVSGALTQIVFTRLFYLQTLCALVAWLHLFGEWLYLGRIPRRFGIGWLSGLLTLALAGSLWLCPKLTHLQRAQYSPTISPASRAAGQHSFDVWDGVFQIVNIVMMGGVVVYFWRVTHPQDERRFVDPAKFRG
jgi:hypothetical protein